MRTPIHISDDEAKALVKAVLSSPEIARLFDTAAIRLASIAMCIVEREHRRARKGGAGQKREAAQRRMRYIAIAQSLVASRSKPFDSYRQLANAVAAKCLNGDSFETIRKHLSQANILPARDSG